MPHIYLRGWITIIQVFWCDNYQNIPWDKPMLLLWYHVTKIQQFWTTKYFWGKGFFLVMVKLGTWKKNHDLINVVCHKKSVNHCNRRIFWSGEKNY